MDFGTLKAALKGIINRKDLTDALAGDFVVRGINDLERVVRFGSMERLSETTTWDGTSNTLPIPEDYLETIDIFTDERELQQVDKALFIRTPDRCASPSVYAKIADRWMLKPTPALGMKVYIHYYAETPKMLVDTDSNVWTKSCFNAALYTAAALAADYYQMETEYASRFSGKADGYVTAILSQDLDEKWSGPMNISRPIGQGDY